MPESEIISDKQLSPREWLGEFEAVSKEVAGSSLWEAEDGVYNGALVMVAMVATGSTCNKDIQLETGLKFHKIARIKYHMLKSGMIFDGRRAVTSLSAASNINFAIPVGPNIDMEDIVGFVANAMAAAGMITRKTLN